MVGFRVSGFRAVWGLSKGTCTLNVLKKAMLRMQSEWNGSTRLPCWALRGWPWCEWHVGLPGSDLELEI